jgi:hypothetical protein
MAWLTAAVLLAASFALAPAPTVAARGSHPLPMTAWGVPALAAGLSVCRADVDPPTYYAIPLVTTKNIPGTGYTTGTGDVTFAASPFGVSIAPDGSYRYDVRLTFQRLPEARRGTYVGWATTSEVDQIVRLGAPGTDGAIRGQVSWNKFLLVVTLESDDDPDAEAWSGPIVLRGMSRSGKMHTMAGHGAFEDEKCATYGYAN